MHVPGHVDAVGGAFAAGDVNPKPAGPEAFTKAGITALVVPLTVVKDVF